MANAKHEEIVEQLDQLYAQAKRQILQNQSAITGLFPSNSAEKSSASIKTSLWAASSIFALYLAYSKRVDNDQGKAHDLGQSVVKCMRGILFAWMRQSESVELFKANQSPKHALHLKFDLHSGLSNDFEYPHLQIDVVSLYLIFLANFIASGLDIIYCMDEVTFIQNLVYYVERAYRTPDYGNLEPTNTSTGNSSLNPISSIGNSEPINCHQSADMNSTQDGQLLEIHATSIGMAKSALEAINGCNLFGGKGANWSIIYSDIDAHSRNRSIFETLLPRESRSKNTDSYLLATISWPCFAANDPDLYQQTKSKILRKLKGKYGLRRFLRDPYGTVLSKDILTNVPVGSNIGSANSDSCPPTINNQLTLQMSRDEILAETSCSSWTSDGGNSCSGSFTEPPRAKQRKSSYFQRKNLFRSQSYQSGPTASSNGSNQMGSQQQTGSTTKMSKRFENIESEWPLFVCFLIIDGIFKLDYDQVNENEKLLYERLLKIDPVYGDYLMPKYYYVPQDLIHCEKCHPDSVERLPSAEGSSNDKLYLTGQALLLTTRLLLAGLVHPNELDPLRRHMPSHDRPKRIGRYSSYQATSSDLVVQAVLVAESIRLQAMMANYGIQTQTPLEVEPVQIWSSSQLVKVYEYLGVNEKLGLKGRPSRPIGALGTSKLYRICGQTILCYPLIFEVSDFYLAQDMLLLIDDIQNELNFIGRYWRMSGRPTVCIIIREEHLRDVHFRDLLDLLVQFKNGQLKKTGLRIKTGRLQNLISSSCIEHLDFLHLLPHEHLPQFKSFRQLVESPKQSLLLNPRSRTHSFTSRNNPKSRRILCSSSSSNLRAIEERASASGSGTSGNNKSNNQETSDIANDVMIDNDDLEDFAEQLDFNISDAGMYKLSSVDLEQDYSTEPSNFIDYYECYKEAPTWPTLIELLRTCSELTGQSQLLAILWEREGPKYSVDNNTIEERFERVSQLACQARNWAVVRYCSAILKRSVESLSPWLTSILVNGKQISLGSGSNEKIINNPLTPTEIHTLIYSTVSTKNPCDAVLQQEIALYIGRLISTRPEFFEGILTIRVNNFMSAMRSYLNIKTNETKEKLLSNQIKQQQLQQQQQKQMQQQQQQPTQSTSQENVPVPTVLPQVRPPVQESQQLLDLRIKQEPQPSSSEPSIVTQTSPINLAGLSMKIDQQYQLQQTHEQQTQQQHQPGHSYAHSYRRKGARFKGQHTHNLVSRPLESLSPSDVRKLLAKVLSVNDSLPISDRRHITGELCRVPKDFYDKVWQLLGCTNIGTIIGGKMLRSIPVLTNMTQDDLNFALKVESLLSEIDCPKLRQVIVEVLMALHDLMKRNQEIRFESEPLDIDKIINLSLEKFRADHGRNDYGLKEYYCNSTETVRLYTVRTVFDCLLPNRYKERIETP